MEKHRTYGMLVHGRIASTSVNGPGNRAIVHFQSCNLGCPGCWNPETHAPDISTLCLAGELANWICAVAVDGVTFSGGEPMQQAYALEVVIAKIKGRRPALSIGMYTGYTLAELDEGKYKYIRTYNDGSSEYMSLGSSHPSSHPWQRIKKHIDFAVMGRFNQLKLDTSTSLRSSTNQKLELFSNRYKESDFESQAIQFTVKDGLVHITGFPVGMNSILEERNW